MRRPGRSKNRVKVSSAHVREFRGESQLNIPRRESL